MTQRTTRNEDAHPKKGHISKPPESVLDATSARASPMARLRRRSAGVPPRQYARVAIDFKDRTMVMHKLLIVVDALFSPILKDYIDSDGSP
jgi:hypothetical protein